MGAEAKRRPSTHKEWFSLKAAGDRTRKRDIPPTPKEQTRIETYKREITTVVGALGIGAKRYEALPDGHVATYTVGEGRVYDYTRNMFVDQLEIKIEDTRTYEDIGEKGKITAEVRIGPYAKPLVSVAFKDGKGGTTTFAYPATPDNLQGVLTALQKGSPTDPRATSWRALQPQS